MMQASKQVNFLRQDWEICYLLVELGPYFTNSLARTHTMIHNEEYEQEEEEAASNEFLFCTIIYFQTSSSFTTLALKTNE